MTIQKLHQINRLSDKSWKAFNNERRLEMKKQDSTKYNRRIKMWNKQHDKWDKKWLALSDYSIIFYESN